MIAEPTVLVLGAGASQPYGFPIGSGLKDTILHGLSNEVERSLYLSSGFSQDDLAEFQDVLKTSPFATIDAILSFRPAIAKIGKFAIVKALSVSQKHDHVFPPRDWYHYLFTRLELENLNAPVPALSVLTFNYDNSFEYFFQHVIRRMFEGDHQTEVRKRYEAIPIVHLHGRLGQYPKDGQDPLENLGQSLSESDIKVISDDDLDESPEFVKAFEIMCQAKRIIYLGFGYAEINCRRLRIHEIPEDIKMYGTCFRMQPNPITSALGREIALCDINWQCDQALKQWKDIV